MRSGGTSLRDRRGALLAGAIALRAALQQVEVRAVVGELDVDRVPECSPASSRRMRLHLLDERRRRTSSRRR